MCGIFGWAGKDPKTFNNDKFNILGMYNDIRGGHSCGVYHNGDITAGIGSLKLFKDFIVKNPIFDPGKQPTVIGHTRMATGGAHTLENAHPFGFGEKQTEEGAVFSFVGVHNGTLLPESVEEIAEKYGVDTHASKMTEAGNTMKRKKIDSEVLLECLYNSESFDVLSDYQGAAALVFSNNNDPNVCYFYHGKSYKDSTDAYNKKLQPAEERPLFYLQESENSLYVSSIRESLEAINEGDDSLIGEFDHNIVYKVTDGNVSKAIKFKVDRSENYQKHWGTRRPPNTKRHDEIDQSIVNAYHRREAEKKKNRKIGRNRNTSRQKKRNIKQNFENGTVVNIHNEPYAVDPNTVGKFPLFKNFRFWSNGHLIDGIWYYISKLGYYKLGDTVDEAFKFYNNHVGLEFQNGDFVRFNNLKLTKETSNIPFKVEAKAINDMPNSVFYFVDGIRMKTVTDYNIVRFGEKKFSIPELSVCSAHPIVDVDNYHLDINKQGIYKNKQLFTGSTCELGSHRNYVCENGNLVSFTLVHPNLVKKDDEGTKCELPSDDNDIPFIEGNKMGQQVLELPANQERPDDKSLVDHETIENDKKSAQLKEEEEAKQEQQMWDIMQEIHDDMQGHAKALEQFEGHPSYDVFYSTIHDIKQHIYTHNYGVEE